MRSVRGTLSCFYAYRYQQSVDGKQAALHEQVQALFDESRGAAGSRSIEDSLRDTPLSAGRYKVRRVMRELGLICKQPGPHAYKNATAEQLDIPNVLNREFEVACPNQVWCGDITYIWAHGRWHYLAVILDSFRRRVVGWAFGSKPDADLVIQALDMAYEQRGKQQGVLFHSDQGGQYASRKFRQRLWRYRMQQSMSRRGNCWDNALMGRLFRSFKSEWVPITGHMTESLAQPGISFCLMQRYNWRRPHQFNKGLPSAVAEEKLKGVSGIS